MLPIGSVLYLHEGTVPIMVVGRKTVVGNDHMTENVYFDYMGCLYPEGVVDDDVLFFNEEDIKEVVFRGYVNEEEEEVVRLMEEWEQLTPLAKGKASTGSASTEAPEESVETGGTDGL
ncbi:DUF4176 domain-containing protein [Numidum massiliense]|uniref:DUF4176 domain-containing protein n=1 Tax=Numidum massiliense TaxID=1522315 RepID=UPI0006D5B018|nr:DUF4176 domain-containing protein [Numidum massiliense]